MGKCLQGKDDDAESTSSSRSNRLKRPAPQDGTVESEPSTSAAGLIAKDNKDDDKEGNNPFHLLVKAARLMNPVQFELSKDIACSTPLPGTFLGGLLFTTVLSQSDFSHGKFGLLSLGKASCYRVALPSLLCMQGAVVFP